MVLEAGKLYKKTGDSFVEVNTEEYVAPALTDALEINTTTPNTIAGNFVSNLESNSLKVSNNVGTGPKVEILKEGAVGLRVNDGTQDVLRAYVDTSGDFGTGDVVIGELTGPNDTTNNGLMWDDSDSKLKLRGDMTVQRLDTSGLVLVAGNTFTVIESYAAVYIKRATGLFRPLGGWIFRIPFSGHFNMYSEYIRYDDVGYVNISMTNYTQGINYALTTLPTGQSNRSLTNVPVTAGDLFTIAMNVGNSAGEAVGTLLRITSNTDIGSLWRSLLRADASSSFSI